MQKKWGTAILLAALATYGCQSAETVKPPSNEAPKPAPQTKPPEAPSAAGSQAAPPSEPQTETVTLTIADSIGRLGTFVLAPGKPGVLTLEPGARRGPELQKVCDRINASESVSIDVESRPSAGHYVSETRSARRGSKSYPDMVDTKLVSEGFKVTR